MLYLYDYLITFPTESACFWKARPTGATVLFFLTRYTTMTAFLLEFAFGFIMFTGTVRSKPFLVARCACSPEAADDAICVTEVRV